MKGCKVLDYTFPDQRVDSRVLMSYVNQNICTGRVIYMPGKWVKPTTGNGPLSCLNSIGDVTKFLEIMYPHFPTYGHYQQRLVNTQIYTCDYEMSIETTLWFHSCGTKHTDSVKIDLKAITVYADRIRILSNVTEMLLPDKLKEYRKRIKNLTN